MSLAFHAQRQQFGPFQNRNRCTRPRRAGLHYCKGASLSASQEASRSLVDQVLKDVENTDGGLAVPVEKRPKIDAILGELEGLNATTEPRPLENPLLFGNFNVAYTSTAKSSERGQPAGGFYRNPIGRSIFNTTGLFQSVLKPNLVINKVAFRMLGLIPGYVGLRGVLSPEPGAPDTVRVVFEPATVNLGGAVTLRLGRSSSVVLRTPYVDERIRLGVGSRGSLFVFTRGGAADDADMEHVGREESTPLGQALMLASGAMAMGLGALAWSSKVLPLQAGALLLWALTLAAASVLVSGARNSVSSQTMSPQQRTAAAEVASAPV